MPKLYSSQHITKVLQLHGFIYISQKGSHVKFRKAGKPTLTAIVPAGHKDIPYGTFCSIMRQSGLPKESFELGAEKRNKR